MAATTKELPACPVETTLTLISDKWKVLTAQLRQMENSGLLIRTVYPEVPPRVEYTHFNVIVTKKESSFDDSLEATTGFEPVIRVLQTHALPLGYVAIFVFE